MSDLDDEELEATRKLHGLKPIKNRKKLVEIYEEDGAFGVERIVDTEEANLIMKMLLCLLDDSQDTDIHSVTFDD